MLLRMFTSAQIAASLWCIYLQLRIIIFYYYVANTPDFQNPLNTCFYKMNLLKENMKLKNLI